MDMTVAQPQKLFKTAIVVAPSPFFSKYNPLKYLRQLVTTVVLQETNLHKGTVSAAHTSTDAASKCWLDVYPVEEEYVGFAGQVVFVDVGGSATHQGQMLKSWYPFLPGRFILQDEPALLARTARTDGIEIMAVNVLDAQLVLGAKFYYLSNACFRRSRAECLAILRNQGRACKDESRILIDAAIVADSRTDESKNDHMSLGQTRDGWRSLAGEAGLKVTRFLTYNHASGESIIECIPT